MPRSIKIDYFQVTLPEGTANTFQEIVRQISQTPDDETRNVDREAPHRLQEYGVWQTCVEGEMLRIRMDQIPVKASLAGVIEQFQMEDDEGVGEETAFLYHPGTRVLVIQRNRSGIPLSKFANYFEVKGQLAGPVILQPLLRLDGIQRLANMRSIRKFEFRIAGITNGTVFRDQGRSLNSAIDLLEEFRAPSVTVSLSMGKKKGALRLQNVVSAARRLFGVAELNHNEVERIEISGRNDDDQPELFDLLEFRLRDESPLPEGVARNVPYSERRSLLRQSWTRHRAEVLRMITQQDTDD